MDFSSLYNNKNILTILMAAPYGAAFLYLRKGECGMANGKENVTFGELEGRDFKEISEITAQRGENEDGE